MVCTCCGCKDCSDIVSGAILYIDSNYERKLNPGLVTGTPMNTITPVIGPPYSVGPGCTPAHFSLGPLQCESGYQFVNTAHNGYVGETILTGPAQPSTFVAHMDGQAGPVGDTGLVFYTGGTGATDQYIDYSNPNHPTRTNISWGSTYLEFLPPGNSRKAKYSWYYSGHSVRGLKFLVNPPPPPLGQTKQMSPVPDWKPWLRLDTGTDGAMGSPDMMGIVANEPSSAGVTGHGLLCDGPHTIQVGTCNGTYVSVGYNNSCIGFCDGVMATTVNGINEPFFQAAPPYTYGSFLHGRLRRLAIFDKLLSAAEVCSLLLCWDSVTPKV